MADLYLATTKHTPGRELETRVARLEMACDASRNSCLPRCRHVCNLPDHVARLSMCLQQAEVSYARVPSGKVLKPIRLHTKVRLVMIDPTSSLPNLALGSITHVHSI